MSQMATDLWECPNCTAPLGGNYCSHCGQKVTPIGPTLSFFLHDLIHELLHVDGKIFRSVWLLLTRPGFLTREYFHGRRARYISPIRLYLIFSIAFFVAAALPGREEVFAADESIEVGALLVQLVTRRSGKTYPQHLYFALHVHAAYFAVLTVTTLLELLVAEMLRAPLSLLQTLFLLGYTLVAFRTAYGGSWLVTVGRTIFVRFVYTNAVTIALILGLAVLAA